MQIRDANDNNVSSPNLTLTATKVERISSEVSDAPLLASGNANPDNNFRLTGDAYTYNLSTKGYQTGTYALSFTVSGDPTTCTVQFQVR